MSVPPYLDNNPTTLLHIPDPKQELNVSLIELLTKSPPKRRYGADECHGLYNGPTSIAYLFLHLNLTHPNLQIASSTPAQWCKRYLAGKRSSRTAKVKSYHCGIIAETLAHLAVSAAVTRDLAHVRKFMSYVPALLKPSSGGSCDWLSGRAGTLYLLRVMRFFVPSAVDLVDPAIQSLSKTILRMGEAAGWEWSSHGKNYLGVAHGAAGIVTQLALSCDVAMQAEAEASKEDIWRPLRKVLEVLLDAQLADGNWAPRLGSTTESDELVQFCHGAPGIVVSFCALMDRGLFPELERMDDAVEEGRDAIWERGLLVKEPCLCHGITGNALALCGEQREHFLVYTTQAMLRDWQSEGVFQQSTDPWGLYGGLAGRAWSFLELLREKEGMGGANGGFIGYSDV